MSDGPIFIQGPGESGASDALKQRAATALEQGYLFVEAHGDPLARLRCQAAIEAIAPQVVVQAIEERQASDGSFARLIPVPSGRWQMELDDWDAPTPVVGSLEALALLAGLKSLVLPAVRVHRKVFVRGAECGWLMGAGRGRRTTGSSTLWDRPDCRPIGPDAVRAAGSARGCVRFFDRLMGSRAGRRRALGGDYRVREFFHERA